MKKRRRTIRVLGKRVPIRFTTDLPRGVDGECDDPSVPNGEIRIREGLSPERELEVIFHEYGHRADWHKSEEWITQTSEELVAIAIQNGWRKCFEPGSGA